MALEPKNGQTTANREPMRDAMHAAPERRRRRSYDMAAAAADKFYFPKEQIPPGSSYEWKRLSVYGLEDPFYIASMREQGWEPVDPKRHANLLPADYKERYIVREGLILMERPEELTRQAEEEMKTIARRQVREAEQRLGMTPNGTLSRDHPDLRGAVGVSKEMMRPVVVDD